MDGMGIEGQLVPSWFPILTFQITALITESQPLTRSRGLWNRWICLTLWLLNQNIYPLPQVFCISFFLLDSFKSGSLQIESVGLFLVIHWPRQASVSTVVRLKRPNKNANKKKTMLPVPSRGVWSHPQSFLLPAVSRRCATVWIFDVRFKHQLQIPKKPRICSWNL